MKKIGLTGGIGSGKSTVAQIFEMLGIPVYYSDVRAKELMCNDSSLKRDISDSFSAQMYCADGSLNRKAMAEVVFRDSTKLALLNSMVHPAVERDFSRWASAQNAPYVIEEAAILIECGAYRFMDEIVVVTAPLATRIERVVKRDNVTSEEVKRRVAAQMQDEERIKYASQTIIADGKELLLPQILKIDSVFRKKTYICTL